jgi:hypothetical protein
MYIALDPIDLCVDDTADAGPFLIAFEKEPERLSLVTISQFIKAINQSNREGISYAPALRLVDAIGEAVEYEHKVKFLENKRAREEVCENQIKIHKYWSISDYN